MKKDGKEMIIRKATSKDLCACAEIFRIESARLLTTKK